MPLSAKTRPPGSGPFGPPDGARANWTEIRDNFVDFADQVDYDDDLASPPDDRSARVIVGKKGVGKTIYLRRFQANAAEDPSIYAVPVEHAVSPATEDVIRVCEFYPIQLAAEGWKWIWRRAIMRALASHLLGVTELRERLTAPQLHAIGTQFHRRLSSPQRPIGVYAEAGSIAAEARSKEQLARELRHRDWIDLENILGEILLKQPPISFYLDSIDEQFATAPVFWLQCQKGLWQEILELYRDARFGNRLHVVASVRDLVRSSMMRGEHATRFTRVPYIRVLDWDHASIRYLLHEKVRRLDSAFLMQPDKEGIRAWLGREDIYNESRGVRERLEDYLLRHTRQIPRDVVHLGNELSERVERAKANGEKTVSDEEIRKAVGVVSKEFADEQITVCANHLASDVMPRDAGGQKYSHFYTSPEYTSLVEDDICRFVKEVGTDRFPMSKLQDVLKEVKADSVRDHPRPLNVLWLNGLLGYDPSDESQHRSHFYGAHDVADFELPDDKASYVFHPILGHKVEIAAAGEKPVRPFL